MYGLVLQALTGGEYAYGASALATLLGIGAGVVVYFILVIALRILRAEDMKGIPHGQTPSACCTCAETGDGHIGGGGVLRCRQIFRRSGGNP